MSHTPRVWNLKRRDTAKYDYFGNPRWEFTAHEITDERGNIIVSDEFGTTLEFDEQDWDLVAAAPEMLEAMEDAYAILGELIKYPDCPEWGAIRTAYKRFNATIAKAKGRVEE
jgi:hypothetical protein